MTHGSGDGITPKFLLRLIVKEEGDVNEDVSVHSAERNVSIYVDEDHEVRGTYTLPRKFGVMSFHQSSIIFSSRN